MFRIEKLSKILILAIAFLTPCLASAAYSPDPIFSELDVRNNSHEFISRLLGEQPLTLADYHKYYTHHSEFESQEDLSHCKKNWGESLSCDKDGKLTLNVDCKNFIRSKYKNKSSHSLFLTRLREILFIPGVGFSIDRVDPIRLGDIWSRFKVYGKIGDKKIELSHARTDLSLELGGLVNLVKIDGIKLWDIVSVNYPETKQCK